MYYQQPETFQHITFNNQSLHVNHYDLMEGTTMPHWHTHFEIVRSLKGISQVHINGSQYDCSPGDILFIPGNSLHSIIPQGHAGYDALVIGDQMTDKLLHNVLSKEIGTHLHNFLHGPQLLLNAKSELYRTIHDSLLNIFNILIHNDSFQEDIIIAEILRIFTYAAKLQWQEKGIDQPTVSTMSQQTELVKEVLNHLEDNYADRITIKDISHRLSISEQHFSRLFKAHTGKTFVEYLTHYRLEEANKLLLGTTLPITRIPEMTGFCNSNYFSRVYKNYYGFPPSKARKLLKPSL